MATRADIVAHGDYYLVPLPEVRDEILSNVVDGGMAYPFYSSDFFHLPIDELSTP